MFIGSPSTTAIDPPIDSTMDASSVASIAGSRVGSPQCPQVEPLGRLHRDEVRTFDGLDHTLSLNSLDRVPNRDRWDHTGYVTDQQPGNHSPHDVWSQQWTGGIVDKDQSVFVGNLSQAGSDRVLSSVTARDGSVEISDDHHLPHSSVDEGSLGPLPERRAAKFEVVLLPSEAGSASGCQQDPPDWGTIVHRPNGI